MANQTKTPSEKILFAPGQGVRVSTLGSGSHYVYVAAIVDGRARTKVAIDVGAIELELRRDSSAPVTVEEFAQALQHLALRLAANCRRYHAETVGWATSWVRAEESRA